MINKFMKKYSASSGYRGMKIKITLIFYLTPVRKTKNKEKTQMLARFKDGRH
jgi:hypothetical protein